jgi:hypothetical protein
MDRSLEPPEAESRFSWLRTGVVVVAAIAVIVTGSWIVRTYPNSGYRAGYEAPTTKGREWIRAEVDAAGGTARSVCDDLHAQAEQSALEPRYDYGTFIKGCGDAVDHLHSRHVPMTADSG